MARYVDADKLTDEIDEWLDSVGNVLVGKGMSYYGELMGCIEDTPTADVVPVVRCKDCVYCVDLGTSGLYCDHDDNRNPLGCRPNDYCNDGERRCEDAD